MGVGRRGIYDPLVALPSSIAPICAWRGGREGRRTRCVDLEAYVVLATRPVVFLPQPGFFSRRINVLAPKPGFSGPCCPRSLSPRAPFLSPQDSGSRGEEAGVPGTQRLSPLQQALQQLPGGECSGGAPPAQTPPSSGGGVPLCLGSVPPPPPPTSALSCGKAVAGEGFLARPQCCPL